MSESSGPVEVVVAGAAGRMGTILLRRVVEDPDLRLVGALEHPESEVVGQPVQNLVESGPSDITVKTELEEVVGEGRVLVDFTRPEATRTFLEVAGRTGTKLVIGTTGLEAEDHRLIEHVSEETAVVRAPNFSVGINLLLNLVQEATRTLGDGFDVEVLEMHHRFKEDAPSGTAKMLAEKVARTRHQELEEVQKIGRQGFEGERDPGEIGVSSLRGGDVVGDHTVVFAGMGERLELTHRASSRETFAAGALRSVKFLRGRNRGLYSMADVLGL